MWWISLAVYSLRWTSGSAACSARTVSTYHSNVTCGLSPLTMWISVNPVSSCWRAASSTSSAIEIV